MSGHEMAASLGLLAWAGFGLPSLIVPFLASTPWPVPLAGALITVAELVLLVRAIRLAVPCGHRAATAAGRGRRS